MADKEPVAIKGIRLKTLRDALGLSQQEFAERIGTHQANLGKMENGKRTIGSNVEFKILNTFNVNPDWWHFGIGGLFENEQKPEAKPKPDRKFESNAEPINIPDTPLEVIKRQDGTEFLDIGEGRFLMVTPLVEQKAYAGYVSGWADTEFVEELPKHAVVVNKLHFGTYRTFRVQGDSMDNGTRESIAEGDLVTARKLHKKYWLSKLHLHKRSKWVIVKYDGIITKEIVDHDVDNGILHYRSLNPAYPDDFVHLDEVQELYYIVINTREME
ncbi:MAG: helix-turn-helix domain-containing protein [Dyadobacter sp.]|uniref:XRE family transcriptional regulator n=1 Tax=Dyadobacter sp. TaxID=1914288 RepID=UPI001B18D180|nr:helix-turn-helix domain-containing protein [Dyadobacter sp.]MBO9613387.1 helix-turn-helix domain-containing protein [Dyadobacter sp.]